MTVLKPPLAGEHTPVWVSVQGSARELNSRWRALTQGRLLWQWKSALDPWRAKGVYGASSRPHSLQELLHRLRLAVNEVKHRLLEW